MSKETEKRNEHFVDTAPFNPWDREELDRKSVV